MIRKLLATAAAVTGLLFVAGCDNTGSDGDHASAGGGATTAASSTAADNTKEICADLVSKEAELQQKIEALIKKAGEEFKAGDSDAPNNYVAQVKRLSAGHADTVEALSVTATNPELKQALVTLATDLRKSNESNTDSVRD